MSGGAQGLAHLFGNAHEVVVKDFQQNRVGRSGERLAHGWRNAGENEIVQVRDGEVPASFHHNGLVIFNDERWAFNGCAGRKGCAQVDRCFVPASLRIEPGCLVCGIGGGMCA